MNARKVIGHAMLFVVLGLIASSGALAQESSDVLDKYLDKYWAEKRKVRVIQKRRFQKDKRHELGIFGGVSPNDAFTKYYPLGLRYDFYFAEQWGLEINYSHWFSRTTDLVSGFEEGRIVPGTDLYVQVPQTFLFNAAIEAVWSPIHGKFGAMTATLGHFDFHITVGVGIIVSKMVTLEQGIVGKGETVQYRPDAALKWGVGARIWLHDRVDLRLELRQFLFYRPEEKLANLEKGVNYPTELTLGVHFWLN
jgi:outer membrane beta-barrel protein